MYKRQIRESAGQLVDAGINLIMNLADGLIAAIPDLLANGPQIIIDLCGVINDNAPKLLMAGVQLIGKLVMGLLQALSLIHIWSSCRPARTSRPAAPSRWTACPWTTTHLRSPHAAEIPS